MTEKLIRKEKSMILFEGITRQNKNHVQQETIDFWGNFEFEHAQFY